MAKIKSSGNGQKCFNVMVTGKVLDVGFRTLIEDIAKQHDLKGYAFNDTDGSVKMVCCGEISVIDEFLDEVRYKGSQKGAAIEDIEKEEITQRIFLPQKFLRLYTDELTDISRKLDVGIEVLKSIKGDTSALPEIKNGIENLNVKFDSFITEQRDFNQEMREHNKEMQGHNKRLEKILEKLSEK